MYLIFKLIHVLAVIIFVGNITIGILWKARADITRDPRVIQYAISTIIAADRIFTIPAIVFVLIGGFAAAAVGHINVLTTGWTLWGLALFIISGVCFGPVSRAQRALLQVTQAAVDGAPMDWTRYQQISAQWNTFGTVATIAPILAVIVMVLKPALPAF
jgi:uncharacterized membrane protein